MAGPGPGKVFVRSAGSWSSELEPGTIFIRDGGVWKEVKSFLVKLNAPWAIMWDEFAGSLRPNTDIETSDWTATPLNEKLDEVTPDDAATEITADFSGSSEQVKDFEVGLSNPIRPTGREVITLRVRDYLEDLVSTSTNLVTIELKQGVTVKVSESDLVPDGYTDTEHVLSQAEKDSITDWDDLSVRVQYAVTGDDGSSVTKGHVTWIELEFS
ncbi:hypothetical protein LCGC14_1966060 [marine sediment metagenome]|uniref:Uncharacterized protein n=1 Tax=marine sediment metagenome TaxID=412755 RepID=A0A0F9HRL3_9ZZZZ